MAQAYDFALDKIGMDIHSYSIWNDYVNFLKAVEAVGSYAENQKISAVRKVIFCIMNTKWTILYIFCCKLILGISKRSYKSHVWYGTILEGLYCV